MLRTRSRRREAAKPHFFVLEPVGEAADLVVELAIGERVEADLEDVYFCTIAGYLRAPEAVAA